MYTHDLPELRTAARATSHPVRVPLPATAEHLWPRFHAYLSSRGLDADLAKWNGWYPSLEAGDDSPRIVIPASASEGHVFWQARAMDENPKRYQSPHHPRRDALVLVYPRPGATRGGAVVVEGPMDALAAAELGALGIALMGAMPPNSVFDAIALLAPIPLIVLADADALGAGARVLRELALRGTRAELRTPHPYKDLAEAPREERMRLLA